MLGGLLLLWAAERAYMVAWSGGVAAMAHARGLEDTTISLGIGPPALRFGRLRVGAIPFGGWVGRDEGAPFPAPLMVVPHLALGLVAGWAAGPEGWGPFGAWLAGLFGWGEVRAGLFHALGAAAQAATEAPLAGGYATWAWLGITNAVLGALQALGTLAGRAGLALFAALQLALLALFLRAVALDVWP